MVIFEHLPRGTEVNHETLNLHSRRDPDRESNPARLECKALVRDILSEHQMFVIMTTGKSQHFAGTQYDKKISGKFRPVCFMRMVVKQLKATSL